MSVNPWLFRRMVRLGLMPPTLPIYAFSDQASEQVAAMFNASADHTKFAEVALFPHDRFAVEMSLKTETPLLNYQKMRTLTAVFPIKQMPFFDEIKQATINITHVMLEIEYLNGHTIIFPYMYYTGLGCAAVPAIDKFAFEIMSDSNARLSKLLARNSSIAQKYNVRLMSGAMPKQVEFYRNRAAETAGFLSSACAVLASPTVDRVPGSFVGRAPGKHKGQERRVETKWTYVDIDLNRVVAGKKTSDGEACSGVALHSVRAHLRTTKHGVSLVRAHMRGDAAFGVRHRVGRVHKSK